MKKTILIISLILVSTYLINKEDKNKSNVELKEVISKKQESISEEIKSIENKIKKEIHDPKKSAPLITDIELKEFEDKFDDSLAEFKNLTSEINKFAISGNAPVQLKEEYKEAKVRIIKLHNLYISKVNAQINRLTKEGKML